MNKIDKLRKAAQDVLDATSDTVEQAVTEPAIDYNTPEDWVTDDSKRFCINRYSHGINSTSIGEFKLNLWLLEALYKTKREAEDALELLKLDAEIKRIVAFYDKDTPLDWGDSEQSKYYFYWDYSKNELMCLYYKESKKQGTLYMTEETMDKVLTVSYTHLTLPTIYSV